MDYRSSPSRMNAYRSRWDNLTRAQNKTEILSEFLYPSETWDQEVKIPVLPK